MAIYNNFDRIIRNNNKMFYQCITKWLHITNIYLYVCSDFKTLGLISPSQP